MCTSAKALMALVVLAMLTTACSMRQISPYDVSDDDDLAHISIDVDWTDMGEDPTGMTVTFYPVNGSQPFTYVTNEVHHIEKSLPDQDYNIVVFNQSVEEFSTLKFRGLEHFETAEIYAIESDDTTSRLDRLYGRGTRGYNTSIKIKPKTMGSGVGSTDGSRGYNTSIKIRPKSNVGNFSASIHIRGLHNAAAVNGALTGLAGGSLYALGQLNQESVTQELDDWTMSMDPDGNGYIHTDFGTFGLSNNLNEEPASNARAAEADADSSPMDDYRNILYLNIRLQDNTYVSYRFDVTSRIREYNSGDEAEVELVLNVGADVSGADDGLNDPLVLPETGNIFDMGNDGVDVEKWGETIDHNIDL